MIKKIGNAKIHYHDNKVDMVTFSFGGVVRVRISRDFALNGGVEPVTGITCRVNGMGPANNPNLTSVLHRLPCADDFHTASCFHDVIYSLGFSVCSRLVADKIWRFINKIEVVQTKPWYKKFYFWRWNNYGYYSIRSGGESSWGTGE